MGLGGKLNFAFFTVIGVMVAAHAGVEIYTQKTAAIQAAKYNLDPVIRELKSEAGDASGPGFIPKRNKKLAGDLASDSAFSSAYASRDRPSMIAAIKSFNERNVVPGFVAVFDSSGRVYYSGDAPGKSPYKPHDIADDILTVMHEGRALDGPAAPTATDTICLVSMVPIRVGGNWGGMVAVCQPLDSEFLTGLKEKVKLTEGVQNVEIALYSFRDDSIVAYTPALMSDPFPTLVKQRGLQIINQKGEFESAGRYWTKYRLETTTGGPLASLLVGTPMPDDKKIYTQVGIESIISLVVGFFLSLIFSAAISAGFNHSMRVLTNRAKDLAQGKRNLEPIEGLSRDFKELGEHMDSAVSGTRISIKQLQGQMDKHQDSLLERQKLVEEANSKVEAINRQLTVQGKQLSEVSKQINQANAQSVFLQQKLASVMQISTEGFLILDAYGNVISANPAFQNWIGVAETELAGRYCFDLVRKPGDPKDNGNQAAFSMHSGVPGDLITQFFPEGVVYNQYDDSKKFEVLAHLQPIMTDEQNIQGYVMVLRDKSLHSDSRVPDQMFTMLQEAVRTPLAVAEDKWSRVLATTTKGSNSQLGNALVDLHLTYQQLLGVVDSLIMMHTGIVPATPIIREQVSVSRLISDCMESCSQTARDHHVMLDLKTSAGLPTTGVDEHLVRDAIGQLLDKMVTVTAAGGRVRVESSAKNNEIRTSIFSSGPALPPEEVEEMFAGFVQGKHAENSYSDRLSLYLVRNNIERIGGRIWAESDRGTYIYLVLPVQ